MKGGCWERMRVYNKMDMAYERYNTRYYLKMVYIRNSITYIPTQYKS